MTSRRNGGSRHLTLRYDTLTYTIESPDGETVTLAGYRRGAGCPISVEIEVESAWAEWSEDRPDDAGRETLTTHRYLAQSMRAERRLRRNLLLAVIPGLAEPAADMLATDAGPWEDILIELGWWQSAAETGAGEAPAGDQEPIPSDTRGTGPPASPESSAPTTASASPRRRR